MRDILSYRTEVLPHYSDVIVDILEWTEKVIQTSVEFLRLMRVSIGEDMVHPLLYRHEGIQIHDVDSYCTVIVQSTQGYP